MAGQQGCTGTQDHRLNTFPPTTQSQQRPVSRGTQDHRLNTFPPTTQSQQRPVSPGCTGTHDHRLNTFSPKSKVFLPVTASVMEHHWSHTLLVSTTGVTVALFIGQHHCQHITASIPLQVSLCHYLASPSKYLSLSVLIPGVAVPLFTKSQQAPVTVSTYSRCHYSPSPSKHSSLSVLIPGVTVPLFTKSQQAPVTVSTYSRCHRATIHQLPASTCHCQYLFQVSLCHYSPSPSKYLSLSVLIPGVTVPVFTRWRHSKHSSLSAYLTVKPLYHFSHAPREVGYTADHCHPPHHHHSQNSAI